MRRKGLTYASSGVSIKRVDLVHQMISGAIHRTHLQLDYGKVLSGYGHYAGLVDIGSCILALHCDGVGTKMLIAQAMKKFNTIGIDCVAMNANDILCVGSRPLAFVDYIAAARPNLKLLRKIIDGLVKGCEEAKIALIGGETAIVPDLLASGDNRTSFELSGTVLGMAKKRADLIMGDKISGSDVILGIESTGLHSNGFTLARKALSKCNLRQKLGNLDRTLGEELLTPTRIYVKPIVDILDSGIEVHGIAHITGGSFSKLRRINNKINFRLNNMPDPPEIFNLIQLQGSIGLTEMCKTFNMGIGMCLIIPRKSIDPIASVFDRHRMGIRRIGTAEKPGNGEVLCKVRDEYARI